jgi:hypothetical protein
LSEMRSFPTELRALSTEGGGGTICVPAPAIAPNRASPAALPAPWADGGGGTTFGSVPDDELNPERKRPALDGLPAFRTDGGGGTTGIPPALGASIVRGAEDPPSSGAGPTADACGSATGRAAARSNWGGGPTTPDDPANALLRGPAAAENGTIGAIAREPTRFGSSAVACLMSGGVTMPGLCSGVTGIAG